MEFIFCLFFGISRLNKTVLRSRLRCANITMCFFCLRKAFGILMQIQTIVIAICELYKDRSPPEQAVSGVSWKAKNFGNLESLRVIL